MNQRLTKTSCFFFFNDTATTEIYTLSLHDALPISAGAGSCGHSGGKNDRWKGSAEGLIQTGSGDRKSTRLNSSHLVISYAVFCLKKKKNYIYLDINEAIVSSRIACNIQWHSFVSSN